MSPSSKPSSASLAVPSLKGRTAIVTGSTSGIGLAIARSFAQAGASVVINGLGDAAAIEKERAAIEADFGVGCAYSPANMMSGEEVTGMVKLAHDRFGSVHILVNNAGIQHVAPIDEFPDDKWEAIIRINLVAAFYAIKAAVPLMKQAGWGRIINIASAHALVASPYKSAYVAAKHGLVGMTKTVALEVAQLDITCNAICPGYVLTPLVEGQIEGQAKAHNMPRDKVIRDVILESQPNKRFIGVEELGALTLFLCGEGGRSITGAALPVDGAWTSR